MDGLLQDTTWSGDGAIERLPEAVAELGGSSVLLVCGRSSFDASGAARVLPALERVASVTRFSDFRPNTDARDVAVGLQVLADTGADTVVAVGGGSALDLAKLLCGFADTDPDRLDAAIGAGPTITQRRHQLVLAPTTSGSGAETTHFAVVYVGDDKHSIAGPAMLPDRILLDPQLTLSAPAYQRATSGIDAVAQAIEGLWAVGSTPDSRAFSRAALPPLLDAIEPYVNDGDAEAARQMAYGSHLAGRSIDRSKTTAAHALSYGITKGYGRSHGHAVATSLGPFLAAQAAADPDRLQPGVDPSAHAEVVAEVLTLLGAADGADGHVRFAALAERIGLDPRLSVTGADDLAAREALAAKVNTERLGNDPVVFDRDDLVAILAAAG